MKNSNIKNNLMKNNDKKSWFKQFWPWFLIALPMVAVVGSIELLFTAIDNKPDMVVDDYYTKGKAINVDLSLLKHAKELGISADIVQQQQTLLINFTGLKDKSSISLYLYHPTLAKRDLAMMLTADAKGTYRFESEMTLTGKWQLRLEPFNKSWRLQKTIIFPATNIRL